MIWKCVIVPVLILSTHKTIAIPRSLSRLRLQKRERSSDKIKLGSVKGKKTWRKLYLALKLTLKIFSRFSVVLLLVFLLQFKFLFIWRHWNNSN